MIARRHTLISPVRFAAAAVAVCLIGCRGNTSTLQGNQIRTALTDLASAEDVYYANNLRYSADQSLIISLTLPRGVQLSVEDADEHGWRATAFHVAGIETCYESGRNDGNSALAVVDGPKCKPYHVSATLHDVRGRRIQSGGTEEDTSSNGPEAPARATQVAANVPSAAPPVDLGSILLPPGDPAEDFGYPTQTIDRLAMRRLLAAKAFDALDRIFAAYADSVQRDYRVEYRLFDAYGAFDVAVPAMEPLLTQWVRQRPNSAAAHFARAIFFRASGWNARGTRLARETSRDQFQRMTNFFRLSLTDVDDGLDLDPKSIAGFRQLIDLARAQGDVQSARGFLNRGLAIQPNSFVLRMGYMLSLLPRWGGSYEMMAQFAEESAPYAKRNPRIAALKGFVDWDQGRRAEAAGRNGDAIEAYQRALVYGNLAEFRYQRGAYNSQSELNEAALEDLNSVLVQFPQYADALNERSHVTYELARVASGDVSTNYFAQAFRDIVMAAALDPTDADIHERLEFMRANIPEYAPAEP